MAAGGGAPQPGLSPVRGQSAGTAASARLTLALPGPASPGARPAAQNAASEPGAGPMALARQRRREAAGGAPGQEKSSSSSHLCQKLWGLGSQRQEASAPGSALEGSGPAHAVGEPGLAQGIVQVLTRAAALWSHFKGCPCWSTLVPAIPKPWDTEGALSQVALAPWQGCGSSPRAAGA
ncbi:uncharacterized protein RBU47_002776 [Passerculus sandwichensis]